ncbi:MAG: EF-P lysine aminoacylase EpmA [Gammaproteobacteria bacterium]|nr:EF-P lysine aminoacylase EpmA [Gammaproteobacteria bacterium]MDH3848528.1 EF-P lysine aminoacylase EpmA [Gammaproteobacteria bacterium]MDH3864323.1 EF-P lysine aminoacylase EpmA [Gammaproteobacteria bacterium]MDH3954850.1 EF-P lysine aminoacylase EpmA [Gammaproteobacteria bacterium]MDH4003348.1 EF-P lysine aminoacylase EpmA [Gammaproteobacteria bacterium]
MNWKASSDVAMVRQRNAMLERARSFFRSRDVLEVDTPALGRCTTSDPNIDSLRVAGPGGATLYLQTSPESFMKRLLADGYPDIYAICRVFREGESGRLHQPEFTMVEWYRHGFGLGAMIDETVAFIADLLQQPELADAEWLEYETAFRRFANIEPFAASLDELADAANADASLRESLGDDRDAWLDLLLGTRVAPNFAGERLTVLRHFPVSQAALARACPADGRVADRFEVFHGAVELANGFVELRDANEQRQRMHADLARRRASARRPVPLDEPLLAALESGLPECAGVAVGFERLLMLATGAADIRDVLTFALDDKDD